MTVQQIKKHLEETIYSNKYDLKSKDAKKYPAWAQALRDEIDSYRELLDWIEDQEAEEAEEAEETETKIPGFEGTAEDLDKICNIRR